MNDMLFSRKTTAWLFVLFMLCVMSCKKDDGSDDSGGSDSVYFIQFTMDGTLYKFVNNAAGNMNLIDAGGRYTFSGAAVKAPNIIGANNVTLAVSNATTIKINTTYVNYATTAAGFERSALVIVSYLDDAGGAFSSWGDEFNSLGITADSKITFSEITNTNLKGTFSGTTYKSISGTAPKHVITNGSFNLKRA